jgi:NitT/TauT family transport system substrate-binding protein
LKVLLLPFLSFAPLFIAEEEGYFGEQGLEVEFVRLEKGAHAIPALVRGDLDVAGGGVSISTLNAMAQGSDIKYVADKGHAATDECAFTALVARRELVEAGGLDTTDQLRGLRVAVDPVNFEGYYVEKLLNSNGLAFDDIEVVAMPESVLPDAFVEGTVDLATSGEPWVTRIVQAGNAVTWSSLREVEPEFQFAGILYGPNLLNKHVDVGRRFMVAYLKAVQRYNQGKTARNLDILTEYTGLDPELVEQACWPAFRDDGSINVPSILDFQAWAVEKGHLTSQVTEEQIWDSSFVEHANEVLGAPSQ